MFRAVTPLLLAVLVACEPPTPPEPLSDCDTRDAIDVLGVSYVDTTLAITVGHAAGCADHQYAICWDQSVAESEPPQVGLTVWHDDGGERCEAYAETEVTVDIQPIVDAVDGMSVQISVDDQTVLWEP